MTSGGYDLAVIGGGLIGSAIAWGARRSGARVVLLDEGDVAHRASRGNFGLVWIQGKGVGKPDYMRLTLAASALWDDFAAELAGTSGIDVAWQRPGGLHFCFSEKEIEARRHVAAETRRHDGGVAIDILDHAEVERLAPGIGGEVAGASFSSADGFVNPLRLLRALHLAFERAGGDYRPGAEATDLVRSTGGTTVSGAGFSVEAARVVIAAGLGSVALAARAAIDLPLRPERGQILVTERLGRFLHYATSHVQQTAEGTVLIGSSHEEAGFSEGTEVATGAELARTATRIFPALAAATLVRHWGGLRILSPDGLPVYEASMGMPGVFTVTCHSGVTLASIHALTFGPALAAGYLPPVAGAFRSERFRVPAH